eukprot:UN24981
MELRKLAKKIGEEIMAVGKYLSKCVALCTQTHFVYHWSNRLIIFSRNS